MTTIVSHHDVSRFFIGLSNETGSFISNLKLQKLLYYAQAWHLARFGKRLFEGEFQAWVHGPVLPESYREFKEFGWKPILLDVNESYHQEFFQKLTKDQSEILEEVIDEYFGETGFELERMTHLEMPWQKARIGLSSDTPSENVIRDEWMIDYYSRFLTGGKGN